MHGADELTLWSQAAWVFNEVLQPSSRVTLSEPPHLSGLQFPWYFLSVYFVPVKNNNPSSGVSKFS